MPSLRPALSQRPLTKSQVRSGPSDQADGARTAGSARPLSTADSARAKCTPSKDPARPMARSKALPPSIPTGALLLVSDQPMIPEGVKTEASDRAVTSAFVDTHVRVGIEALKLIRRHGKSVKHLRFDESF